MISVFELFKIGIGPSSSHTVGPMKAAGAFVAGLETERVARVKVTLFGSLAFTGKGHATDRAIILGLAGEIPETVDSDRAEALLADAATRRRLPLAGRNDIAFDPEVDIVFDFVSTPPRHPNTMSLRRVRRERRIGERGDLAFDRRRLHRSRRRVAGGAGERRRLSPSVPRRGRSAAPSARGGADHRRTGLGERDVRLRARRRSRRGSTRSSARCSLPSIAASRGRARCRAA